MVPTLLGIGCLLAAGHVATGTPPAQFAPGGNVRALRPRPAMQPVPLTRPLARIPVSSHAVVSTTDNAIKVAPSAIVGKSATSPPHRRPLVLDPPKPGAAATGTSRPASQMLYRGVAPHRRPLGW